jgi:hypothetical protein
LIFPLTSNFYEGDVVPIPISPVVVIRILSEADPDDVGAVKNKR